MEWGDIKHMFESERVLRTRLAALITEGASGVDAFQEWFVENVWVQPGSLAETAATVELALAEYTGGTASWDETVAALLSVADRSVDFTGSVSSIDIEFPATAFTASAAAETQRVEVSA